MVSGSVPDFDFEKRLHGFSVLGVGKVPRSRNAIDGFSSWRVLVKANESPAWNTSL